MNSRYSHSIAIFLALLLCLRSAAQDSHYYDSLINIINTTPHDTTKLRLLNLIARNHDNADTVVNMATAGAELARKLKDGVQEARAESYLYWGLFFLGNYQEALSHARRAAVISDSINNKALLAKNYHNMAVVYATKFMDGTKGDEFYHKALKLYTEIEDSSSMCDVLRDIASNNYLNDIFDKAEECFREAMRIDSLCNNIYGIVENYIGYALTYEHKLQCMPDHDEELMRKTKNMYIKALRIADSLEYTYAQDIIYKNITTVLLYEAEKHRNNNAALLDSVEFLLNKGYVNTDQNGYDGERISLDHNKIWMLALRGKFKQAIQLADSAKNVIDNDSTYFDHYRKIYNAMSLVYELMGDFPNAIKCISLAEKYGRSSRKKGYLIASTQSLAQIQFDEEMQTQKEREKNLEMESKQQQILLFASIIVMLLLVTIAVIISRWYMHSRRDNKILDQKNAELEQQKREILSQNETISSINKELTDSINYASIIQQAVMPYQSTMDSLFGQHLLIYKPLNIVSGDFYWAFTIGRYKMLAVGDCTGHGVPGAILSMLGISILNYIAPSYNEQDDINAAVMLDKVNSMFKLSLHQISDKDNHDGIDIALIIIDTENMKLHFAGAYRPLIVFSNGTLTKYKANKMPIGIHYMAADHFTNTTIDIKSGDVIYMFSDGITDQFGYDETNNIHKFTGKRFYNLLSEINPLPFDSQKQIIESTMRKWRTDKTTNKLYEQTDDAILVGIRI